VQATATRPENPEPTAPKRPKRRRVVRALASLLMVVGVLLLADAAVTLVWQEPLTALYAHVQQDQLEHRLTALDDLPALPAERRVVARQRSPQRRLALAARFFDRHVHAGDPVARVKIPPIGVSAVVVQGTSSGDLSKGPGHYPKTPLPGRHGTVAIAGHRTTFGAWFRHIDELERRDPIEVVTPYGSFTYRVQRTRIVPSDAWWITRKVGHDQLVLSACHPLYSASQRIVVFARLVGARARSSFR
jgi:sortase A